MPRFIVGSVELTNLCEDETRIINSDDEVFTIENGESYYVINGKLARIDPRNPKHLPHHELTFIEIPAGATPFCILAGSDDNSDMLQWIMPIKED